jgi:hypothetical protein
VKTKFCSDPQATNMTTNLLSVPLAAAALVLLLLQPCSSNTTAEEKMFQWVREAGGKVSVLTPETAECRTQGHQAH